MTECNTIDIFELMICIHLTCSFKQSIDSLFMQLLKIYFALKRNIHKWNDFLAEYFRACIQPRTQA